MVCLIGPARLALAGINTRPLLQALQAVTTPRPRVTGADRLGDRAALAGWERGCLFLDYTYVTCPDGPDKMRLRLAFQGLSPGARRIPLYLDSAAYRRWTGDSPGWDSIERYCQAIDLLKPDGYMAYDTIGDLAASVVGYEQMVALGYTPIPVWQFRQAWDPRATATVTDHWGVVTDEDRAGIANARRAAQDPVLQYFCAQSPLVALGGMARGPAPMWARVAYLKELCRLIPDQQWWALAQARDVVVNGLGQAGLLERVWTDGAWWIHHARCERFAVVQDGLLKTISLTGQARSFFTLGELAAANARSLMGGYLGHWTFPAPAPIPDVADLDGMQELKARLQPVQASLLDLLPGTDEEEAV